VMPVRPFRVALLAPMPSELKPLTRRLRLQRTALDGRPLWRGRMDTAEIVAVRVGMGPAAGRATAEFIMDRTAPDHVVVVGVAGGVGAGLRVGDVVVPDEVVDHESGTVFHAHALGSRPPRGRLVTSDQLLIDGESRRVQAETEVDILDMETAGVASVCEQRGMPWSAVRALSDHVDEELVDDAILHLARPDGTPDLPAVAHYVITKPWRIPLLARLGRNLRTATNAAADEAIRLVAEHSHQEE